MSFSVSHLSIIFIPRKNTTHNENSKKQVTVFDPNQQRQAALLRHTGANLHLGDVSSDGGFDVAVEVSGAAEGLAMAIQKTRRGEVEMEDIWKDDDSKTRILWGFC